MGARGLLVAVVGPSGAGKDTLIRLALEGLGADLRLHLARRVITRAADDASEDHDSLDAQAFDAAEAQGNFCLTWRANGLAYALPARIESLLAEGACVLANLSRRSLLDAARRFGRIAIVEITARPDLLLARITARGREPPAAIAERLARQVAMSPPPGTVSLRRIDNSGPAEDAAAELRRHLLELLSEVEGIREPA